MMVNRAQNALLAYWRQPGPFDAKSNLAKLLRLSFRLAGPHPVNKFRMLTFELQSFNIYLPLAAALQRLHVNLQRTRFMSSRFALRSSVLPQRSIRNGSWYFPSVSSRLVSSISAIRQGLSRASRAGANSSSGRRNEYGQRDWRTDVQDRRSRVSYERRSPERSETLKGNDWSRRAHVRAPPKESERRNDFQDRQRSRFSCERRSPEKSETANSDEVFHERRVHAPPSGAQWRTGFQDRRRSRFRYEQRAPEESKVSRDDKVSHGAPVRGPPTRIENEIDDSHPRRPRTLPLSVLYTTPASEFLYGTSVVTEALDSNRRKAYTLYIYDGQNREEANQRRFIEKLAQSKGVLVRKLPDPQLLNKLSKGRPHNVSSTRLNLFFCGRR